MFPLLLALALASDPAEQPPEETEPAKPAPEFRGGFEGGVIGGVEGGVVGGQVSSPRSFHHSELAVRHRVTPDYPPEAAELGPDPQMCKVRVFIEEQGVPYNFIFESCARVFHDSVRTALADWRWHPAKFNGEKVKAQFLMNVRFNPPRRATSTADGELPSEPNDSTSTTADPTPVPPSEPPTPEPAAEPHEPDEGYVIGGPTGMWMGEDTGALRFHHTDVQVRRRRTPSYPAGAAELGPGAQICKVRVFIDERGAPYDVLMESCDSVFHDSARTALAKWRWYPPRFNGEKVKAQFLMDLRFEPPEQRQSGQP